MRCGAFHRVEGTLCLVRHGQAALSGSKTKAPGFAGGYLLAAISRVLQQNGFAGFGAPSTPRIPRQFAAVPREIFCNLALGLAHSPFRKSGKEQLPEGTLARALFHSV